MQAYLTPFLLLKPRIVKQRLEQYALDQERYAEMVKTTLHAKHSSFGFPFGIEVRVTAKEGIIDIPQQWLPTRHMQDHLNITGWGQYADLIMKKNQKIPVVYSTDVAAGINLLESTQQRLASRGLRIQQIVDSKLLGQATDQVLMMLKQCLEDFNNKYSTHYGLAQDNIQIAVRADTSIPTLVIEVTDIAAKLFPEMNQAFDKGYLAPWALKRLQGLGIIQR